MSARPSKASGRPLPRKLGIAPGHRVAFAGAPKDFPHDALDPLPDGVAVRTRVRAPLDVTGCAIARRGSTAKLLSEPLRDARLGAE